MTVEEDRVPDCRIGTRMLNGCMFNVARPASATSDHDGRRLTMIPVAPGGDDAEMFDLAPVSLWLEDFSGVRQLFQEWRAVGVTDLAGHLRADPSRIKACSERIRVLKVNARTLT